MRIPVPDQIPAAADLGHVHLVGIGGAALSGIARILLARGHVVSGSDAQDSPTLQALRDLGAVCHVGHVAEQVEGADTVVVSTAVRDDNPEVAAARELGLLLLPRAAAVAALLDGYQAVAVAGTHGKTTTTSLLSVALIAAGADPSYAIGADLSASGSNAHHGGELFVVEADESDGAFLAYSPQAAIITNVDVDHLDIWGTEEAYVAAFGDFLGRIQPGGFAVLCVDDAGAARLAGLARQRRIETVGCSLDDESADLVGTDIHLEGTTSRMTVWRGDELLGDVELQIPGRHYLLDALAALACGLRLGYDFEALAAGMRDYTGTRRRMELKGEVAGVRVFDSYAHHPREITADLQGARAVAGDGRLVVCFQPHLVSRTKAFGRQMGVALGAADVVVVADIYLAREDPEVGVTGALVADAVPLPEEDVHYQPDFDSLPDTLARIVRTGDMVVTLGAGNVTAVGPLLLERLGRGLDEVP